MPRRKKITFVSYDGKYPSLCLGTLIIKIGRKIYKFEMGSLSSGGGVYQDDEGYYSSYRGEWSIYSWPKDFPEDYKDETIELINSNIRHGCCGGCS